MADAYIGEIRLLPFNFTPRDWLLCAGQILAIQTYSPLFAIIGTMYGGNGTTNFALPDLRSRVAMGVGNTLSPNPGVSQGTETVTLTTSTTPPHSHGLTFANAAPTQKTGAAAGNFLAPPVYLPATGTPAAAYAYAPYTTAGLVQMAPQTVSFVGQNAAHENRQPYLGLGYFIATDGMFPSRN